MSRRRRKNKNGGWKSYGLEKRIKTIKVEVVLIFDRLDDLNQPWPFIFIGWDGLIPQGIPFTDLDLQKT